MRGERERQKRAEAQEKKEQRGRRSYRKSLGRQKTKNREGKEISFGKGIGQRSSQKIEEKLTAFQERKNTN